jgi:uncharacterized protein
MATKVVAFVKSDARDLKETYIHFFGGEPLIRPAVVDIWRANFRAWSEERKIKLKLGVTTNGTLLTKPNCEMLKRHDVGVQLSLDGSREGHNVHRQLMGGGQCGLRPAGAFDLVRIDNYFSYFGKGRPNCRMTVTIHNVEFLATSIRELHAMGFKSFSIIPDSDCGEWTKDYLARYEAKMSEVFEYWAANREIEVNAIEHTMEKLVRKQSQPHLCQAGRSILGITVDGDIYPCHDFSGKFSADPAERARLLIGNIEKGFTANQLQFSDLQAEQAKPGNGYDCSVCWAKWACSRGCPYMNYARSGEIMRVNAVYCDTTRIHATLALRWMSVLGDHRFLRPADIRRIREKLARAVLNAAGGEEDAPFGRGKDGRALLPSAMKMRELGFDPWEERRRDRPPAGRLTRNGMTPEQRDLPSVSQVAKDAGRGLP